MRFQDDEGSSDGGDDFLQSAKTQTHLDLDLLNDHLPREPTSKKALKRIAKTRAAALRSEADAGSHLKFDDDDNAVDERQRLVGVALDDHAAIAAAVKAGAHDLRDATLAMQQSDVIDRMVEKERLRAKKRERKAKLRRLALPEGFEEGPGGVVLAQNSGSDDDNDQKSRSDNKGNYDDEEAAYSSDDQDSIQLSKKAKRLNDAEDIAARLLGMS